MRALLICATSPAVGLPDPFRPRQRTGIGYGDPPARGRGSEARPRVEVAAVGPRYLDDRQDNPPPFIRLKGIQVRRQPARGEFRGRGELSDRVRMPDPDGRAAARRHHEGGTLHRLRRHRMGASGPAQGVPLLRCVRGTDGARVGDPPIRFLGRNLPLHSPLRHYYHFRNAVWLYRQGGIPWQWKLADGWRLTLKYGFYTLFARPRHKHWWMMTKGVCHGLCNRMGPYR
jgi:rhamnosyltransferase